MDLYDSFRIMPYSQKLLSYCHKRQVLARSINQNVSDPGNPTPSVIVKDDQSAREYFSSRSTGNSTKIRGLW